jgi:hypothetical protein
MAGGASRGLCINRPWPEGGHLRSGCKLVSDDAIRDDENAAVQVSASVGPLETADGRGEPRRDSADRRRLDSCRHVNLNNHGHRGRVLLGM